MENRDIDMLTKNLMADSRLNLTRQNFDETIMKQILYESNKQKNREQLLLNILIFAGIESVIFTILLVLLLNFPGDEYLSSTIKISIIIFQRIGKFAIQYDYLILSFIVVGFLDMVMNKRRIASLRHNFPDNLFKDY